MGTKHTMNQNKPGLFMSLRTCSVALFIGITGFAQTSMASSTINSLSQNVYGGTSDTKSLNGANGSFIQVNTNANGVNADYASGNASASEGLLGVSASANGVTVGGGLSRFQNYARSAWQDSFIVNSSGLSGTGGYIIAQLGLNGSYSGTAGVTGNNNSTEYYNSIKLLGTGLLGGNSSACGGYDFCGWQDHYAGADWGGLSGSNDFSNLTSALTARIPVIFGASTSIGYTLDLVQLGYATTGPGGLGIWANAQNNYTLSWNGIAGVFDSNGRPVTNFTAASASGHDYAALSAPVPLPAAFGMLISGLGLLGVFARREQAA